MKRISRRGLLASGLVLPSSAYLSRAGILPAAAAPRAFRQDAAVATLNPDATSGKELYLLCWDNYKATGMETWLPDFEAEMGGSVVLDLGRLDRIVDFDEALAWVTVQPGVSFGQIA